MTRYTEANQIDQHDHRLGRQIVHDSKSREFAAQLPRSTGPFKSVMHRLYDPYPLPAQTIGNCTFVAECMLGNSVGNRIKGEVLNMDLAVKGYSIATTLDPFLGVYPPSDTGSSGLAAAKAAKQLGIIDRYEWYFGLDAILRGLQTRPISFGGYWYWDMFEATKKNPLVRPTGGTAGGHQWVLIGYDAKNEHVIGKCWWGKEFGDNGRFRLTVPDFAQLVQLNGDAHYSYRNFRPKTN